MARDHGDLVKMGLELKKAGNALFACLGGREVHPVNVRVGGFYRAPTAKELAPVLERLKGVREAAVQTVRWTGTLPFPVFEPDYEFVALSHPQEYAITRGRLKSSRGLDIPVSGLRGTFHRGAGTLLPRPAVGAAGRRGLFRRPPGPLQPQF